MADRFEFDLEAPDLRSLLERVSLFDQDVAKRLRAELRRSGDVIIAEQRALLAGAKPGSIRKAGSTIRTIKPRNRASYSARRNVYETGDDRAAAASNLRQRISRGLTTRVVTSSRRQTVMIRTAGPREGGYNLALLWEKRIFRHPVYGNRRNWVYQQGRPYFYDPIRNNTVKVRQRIADAVERALRLIGDA